MTDSLKIGFRPVSDVAAAAASDLGVNYNSSKMRLIELAVRGYEKISSELSMKYTSSAMLLVNHQLNNAMLPCDFGDLSAVGYINDCDEFVPFVKNGDIIDRSVMQEIGCYSSCEKCQSCYTKEKCNELTTEKTVNVVIIDGMPYNEEVFTTITDTGEVFRETVYPYYNNLLKRVDFGIKKEFVDLLEMSECGCVKKSEQNDLKIKSHCHSWYSCNFSKASSSAFFETGYLVFKDSGTIQFDELPSVEKVYIRYFSSMPKLNGVNLIPEASFEMFVEFVKWRWIKDKKRTYSQSAIRDAERDYLIARDNYRVVSTKINYSEWSRMLMMPPKIEQYGSMTTYNYYW